MTKRRTMIVRYSDCCKRTIIEEIEKKGLKIGLTPEQANKFLQEELIPDLKEKIIKAKNSGMNLNEYFNFFLTNEIFYYRRIY